MQPACVIVMQMRNDNCIDGFGLHAKRCERAGRVAQDRAVAVVGFGRLITSIDQSPPVAALQQPDEIIHTVGC